jgi:hypothetical protein
MCCQEVRWAEQYGKPIVAVADVGDKGKIGAFIAEAKRHGLDFSGIDFCTYDRSGRSGPNQVKATLQDIMDRVEEQKDSPKKVVMDRPPTASETG